MKIVVENTDHFSLNRDTMLNILLCIVWASALLSFSRGIINRLPVLGDHTDVVIALAYILPTIAALPALINRLTLIDYLFYFVLVFGYLASYILFPDNEVYLTENIFLCLFCVYPYFFVGRVIDIDRLFNAFLVLSTVSIYMFLFYYTFYAPSNKVVSQVEAYDNMYAAYQALPHVAMLMWATLQRFRLWKAFTTLVGILFLLSCGTRGTLVCLGFFFVVYFFFYMNFKGAIYVKAAIVSLVLLVLAFLRQIALFLFDVFTEYQLSTRIIEKFVFGDLGNDSLRGALRDIIYRALDDGNHFWGLGLFGCRNYGIIYPHFLPLDFFCTYGYFLGSILLVLLFVLVVWAFWTTRGTKAQEFILLLFSVSIIKLMLTGTFVTEMFFYFLIGFCMKQIFFSRPTVLPTPSAHEREHE